MSVGDLLNKLFTVEKSFNDTKNCIQLELDKIINDSSILGQITDYIFPPFLIAETMMDKKKIQVIELNNLSEYIKMLKPLETRIGMKEHACYIHNVKTLKGLLYYCYDEYYCYDDLQSNVDIESILDLNNLSRR